MQIDFARYVEAGLYVLPVKGKLPHWDSLPRGEDGKPTWIPLSERHPTDVELQAWELSDATGIAVFTGERSGIIALDNDCFKEYPEIKRYIPESPVVRIGKEPKWMRLYKYNKDLSKTEKIPLENGDLIELLSNGRYFVADGIHPDTGKPYFYVDEHLLDNIDNLPEFPLKNWQAIKTVARKYAKQNDFTGLTNGGRHDSLVQYTGQLISLGMDKDTIVQRLIRRDAQFDESYFKTHNNTPERMVESLSKSDERSKKKKKERTKKLLLELAPKEQEGVPSKSALANVPLDLDVTDKGKPLNNLSNAYRIIAQLSDLKGAVWYDEFHCKYFTTWGKANSEPREWSDGDDLLLTIFLQTRGGLTNIKDTIANQAMRLFASMNIRNEPKDWLATIEWDGTPRIDNFFSNCLWAGDDDYVVAASKNFWIALVARIYNPGCKVDNMVILEGEQGILKSSALRAIGGKWFTELAENIETKDFKISLQGKLLIEIGELAAFSNQKGSQKIKQMITNQVDRFRAVYGKAHGDHPRQCIFVGSTNDSEYLKDVTGGRRFWPIKVGSVDLDKIKEDREQLFAEARDRYLAGESWWEMPESIKEVQESRREKDEWEQIIADWLSSRIKESFFLKEVAERALDMNTQDLDRMTQLRIGHCLRLAGWENKPHTINGKSVRKWRKIWSLENYR